MTNFKTVKYLRQGESFNYDYELLLPEPLANWDVFDYWERERIISIRENVTKDDILFDVGSEHGWLSVVIGKHCKVFLIEPTKEFWPNIRETWKRNILDDPAGCYSGLLSNKTTDKTKVFSWPNECSGELIDKNKYEYINQNSGIGEMMLDELVKRSGITPTAINIDVEGAELLVLSGAIKTLKKYNLKVWVSEHDDLAEQGYGVRPGEIDAFMRSLGYVGKFLAKDHEKHLYYSKDQHE